MSTSALSIPVSIGNIDDAEKFVQHCMNKAKGILNTLNDSEKEDLMAEGLCLLVELHHRYDPAKDKATTNQGGTTTGFYGYALYLLPLKLGAAWHRSQPHHVLRTQADGKRRYDYLAPAKSLDQHLDTIPKSLGTNIDGPNRKELHDGNTRTPGNFVAAA